MRLCDTRHLLICFYWSDLHESFTRDMYIWSKKKNIKFWKSSTSRKFHQWSLEKGSPHWILQVIQVQTGSALAGGGLRFPRAIFCFFGIVYCFVLFYIATATQGDSDCQWPFLSTLVCQTDVKLSFVCRVASWFCSMKYRLYWIITWSFRYGDTAVMSLCM